MKPELARRAKAYARRTDRTFTELVEDAVSQLLEQGNSAPPKLPPLTVVTGTTAVSSSALKRAVERLDADDDRCRLGVPHDPAA